MGCLSHGAARAWPRCTTECAHLRHARPTCAPHLERASHAGPYVVVMMSFSAITTVSHLFTSAGGAHSGERTWSISSRPCPPALNEKTCALRSFSGARDLRCQTLCFSWRSRKPRSSWGRSVTTPFRIARRSRVIDVHRGKLLRDFSRACFPGGILGREVPTVGRRHCGEHHRPGPRCRGVMRGGAPYPGFRGAPRRPSQPAHGASRRRARVQGPASRPGIFQCHHSESGPYRFCRRLSGRQQPGAVPKPSSSILVCFR